MPNQATITIRSLQIAENPTRVWNPHGDDVPGDMPATPPSVIVADYWCTSAGEGCAFAQDGPDLVVPEPATAGVDPTTVQAGQTVTFPTSSVGVENVGNQPAQEHRIGYYISAADSVGALPRNGDGTIDTSGPETELLETVDAASLDPGDSEPVNPTVLTIPVDIPRPNTDGTGTYFLYAYVDDLRVVSEINEDDNFIQGGPITVTAPGYSGILGLFSPCSGLTCERNAGPALPFAFQLTFDGVTPVDSETTPPRLVIFEPVDGAGSACQTNTNVAPLFIAEPDDVASGSSGWQYFDASCLPAGTCSRDAFTHQYNWQTKDPDTGAKLPPGCYTVVIEVPATDQAIDSLLGPVEFVEVTLN
jgi:hypothetical protein